MADFTFVDADYLNYLAEEDARFDASGVQTPRLDALLGSSGQIVITSTVRSEATFDLSFVKDRVLSNWIARNDGANILVVQTGESPFNGGGSYQGKTIGGGEASIQNYINDFTSTDASVNIYTNNLKDYKIDEVRPTINLSPPYQSKNEMLFNGEISLSQYDNLAFAFQSNGVVPKVDSQNGGLVNFAAFLFDGLTLEIRSSDGGIAGTVTRIANRLIVEFNNAAGTTKTIGYDEAAEFFDFNDIGIGWTGQCFGPEVPIDMWPTDPAFTPDPSDPLKQYDKDAVRAKIWQKPIELVQAGDIVVSFDKDGNLVPGEVARTMTNDAKILLDFHGTHVTPGHVYYRPDSNRAHKFETLIDILRDDGVVQLTDGSHIRAAINVEVGTRLDQLVKVIVGPRLDDGAVRVVDEANLRLGSRVILEDGRTFTIADFIDAAEASVIEDGLVKMPSGETFPFHWEFGDQLSKPEDYVLQRSGTSLEEIYKAAEWEDQYPQMPAPMTLEGGPVKPLRGVEKLMMKKNEV